MDSTHARAFVDAFGAMAPELEFASILERLVAAAAALADASYGALSLVDGDGDAIEFVTTHPEFTGVPPRHADMNSFLRLEVRARGKVLGHLYLADEREDAFSADAEQVLQSFAAGAGLVIDNARAYELSETRTRWFAASAAITQSLVGEDLDTAFQQVADLAREVSGASASCVALLRGDDHLEVRVVSGPSALKATVPLVPIAGSIAGVALRSGTPLVIPELSEHPADPTLIRSIGLPQVGPAAMLPLRTTDGNAGLLVLAWDAQATVAFGSFDLHLASGFAEQAALALKVSDARAAEERRNLTEDRDRIARELHDVVIQRLFAIGMLLDHAATTMAEGALAELITKAVDDLDVSIKDIRTSIFKLQNARSGSLRAGVLELVEEYAVVLGFAPSVVVRGPVDQSVTGSCCDDALAVLREALSNVARHAQATAAEVSVEATATHLTLVVGDDGRGLPMARSESGLSNARARAEARGGHLRLMHRDPQGTTLEWTVQLD